MATYHFQYAHPTFGTKKNPAPEENWRNTVYYYWWAFLRRHDGYRECCEQGGAGPFAGLYADFGNAHTSTFKEWWNHPGRAKHLFAEPKSPHHFEILTEPPTREDLADPDVFYVKVPLNFPKRALQRYFAQTLAAKKHTGERGKQYARMSRARYRVRGQPNLDALQKILAVYDRWREQPKPLWCIAVDLHLFHLDSDRPTPDEANAAAATTSRYLRKAKLIIENVGRGVFPYEEGKRKNDTSGT